MELVKFCIDILLILYLMFGCSCTALDSLDALSPCPVYLTISSISRHTESSHLEINWGPNCSNPPNWIGVYGTDPSVSYDAPFVTIQPDGQQSGHMKTNIKLGKINLPYGWNLDEASINTPKRIASKCLPFYIASFVGNQLQTSDCLKIQPNWMSSMKRIANIPLKELFLPGTHCSGCYDHKSNNRRSILLKKFGYVQNFDVWTQLVFGIRFLDISVGYHENKNHPEDATNFWIVNENLLIAPLLPVLKQIRTFANVSGEVIVVDFSGFPIGFYNNPERHLALIRLLEQELGDFAYTRNLSNGIYDSGDLTLRVMRQEGKLLLITYNDEHVVEDTELVWSSWRKFSTINLPSNDLKEYIRKTFSKKFENSPQNVPWVVYGIQGVDTSYMPGSHLPTARERANSINKSISYWLNGPWSMNANVVALDFFAGSNLIDIAIDANFHKKANSTDYIAFHIPE